MDFVATEIEERNIPGAKRMFVVLYCNKGFLTHLEPYLYLSMLVGEIKERYC